MNRTPRVAILALLGAACASPAEFVQAVEFPYYHHPRGLWERELVWLKNIGIQTVAFSAGQKSPAADPRGDMAAFLKILRRLQLRAWIYSVPLELAPTLEPQLEKHGGPIAFVEGPSGLNAAAPPAPITRLSATAPTSLLRSRDAFAGSHGSLLWKDVEDTLAPTLQRGVVSFTGEERPGAATLRRDALLLQRWAAILPNLHREHKLTNKMPARQFLSSSSHGPSAVTISNRGTAPLAAPLQVFDASVRRYLIIPKIEVPVGESLWLPVNVPLASGGLCDGCAAFAPADRIVYSTAEILSIEFENGILACELIAPVPGEVVIQLSQAPSGPYLAGGAPANFEWDEKSSAVKLSVPAGKGPLKRVRIGLATEPPDASAFFGSLSRLIIGHPNLVTTSYSSEALASRSRLLAPPGFRVKAIPKSPLEIDYEVTVPADAPHDSIHGEFVNLALEADGVRLGRTRLQLFRPASLRIRETAALHLGADAEVAIDPPLVSFDPKAGRELHIVIRNNYPSIQNYIVEASGPGLTFLPPRTDVSIAATVEREVSVRVFADDPTSGVRRATIRVTGAAQLEQQLDLLSISRNETAAYERDLDGDGAPDRILENQRVRASFSGTDGRWMEWVWKDSNTNFLPETGAYAGAAPITAQSSSGKWEFEFPKGKRAITLGPDNRLRIQQDTPLPPSPLKSGKRDGVNYTLEKSGPNEAVYWLERAPQE